MVDVSNPQLAEYYQDVRNDTTPTDWCLFGYSSDGKAIEPINKGEDGLEGMKSNLDESKCFFGFLRVTSGDEESKRAKFVFITFGGTRAPVLRRAKMSVHKDSVHKVIKDYAITVHAESVNELDFGQILATVKKAGGADYSGSITKN